MGDFVCREMASTGLAGTLSPSIGNLSHLKTMWVNSLVLYKYIWCYAIFSVRVRILKMVLDVVSVI